MANGERIDGVRSVVDKCSHLSDWRKSGSNANTDTIPDTIPDTNAFSYSHSFTCHNSDANTNSNIYADAGINTSTNSDAKRIVLSEPESHSSV